MNIAWVLMVAALAANDVHEDRSTLTLEVEGDEIEVHALTRESAADLESGEMDRRVTWVEGEES